MSCSTGRCSLVVNDSNRSQSSLTVGQSSIGGQSSLTVGQSSIGGQSSLTVGQPSIGGQSSLTVNSIGGPSSLSEHLTEDGKRIYIFGDIHTDSRCYCRSKGIEIVPYLKQVLSYSSDIDLYLEIDRDVYTSWDKEPSPNQTIYHLFKAFPCTSRIKYVDVRYIGKYTLRIMRCSNFFTKRLHRVITNLYFDNSIIQELQKVIPDVELLFPIQLDVILSETENISIPYFSALLEGYTIDHMLLLKLLRAYTNRILTETGAEKLLTLINMLSLYMMSITDLNVCNLLCNGNNKVIIYIGEDHANSLREYLGNVVAYSPFSETQCIPIANFKQPFFS